MNRLKKHYLKVQEENEMEMESPVSFKLNFPTWEMISFLHKYLYPKNSLDLGFVEFCDYIEKEPSAIEELPDEMLIEIFLYLRPSFVITNIMFLSPIFFGCLARSSYIWKNWCVRNVPGTENYCFHEWKNIFPYIFEIKNIEVIDRIGLFRYASFLIQGINSDFNPLMLDSMILWNEQEGNPYKICFDRYPEFSVVFRSLEINSWEILFPRSDLLFVATDQNLGYHPIESKVPINRRIKYFGIKDDDYCWEASVEFHGVEDLKKRRQHGKGVKQMVYEDQKIDINTRSRLHINYDGKPSYSPSYSMQCFKYKFQKLILSEDEPFEFIERENDILIRHYAPGERIEDSGNQIIDEIESSNCYGEENMEKELRHHVVVSTPIYQFRTTIEFVVDKKSLEIIDDDIREEFHIFYICKILDMGKFNFLMNSTTKRKKRIVIDNSKKSVSKGYALQNYISCLLQSSSKKEQNEEVIRRKSFLGMKEVYRGVDIVPWSLVSSQFESGKEIRDYFLEDHQEIKNFTKFLKKLKKERKREKDRLDRIKNNKIKSLRTLKEKYLLL